MVTFILPLQFGSLTIAVNPNFVPARLLVCSILSRRSAPEVAEKCYLAVATQFGDQAVYDMLLYD